MENVQESEIGDVRPTSHGSDSLQNCQKCNNYYESFANQLCDVFCTESDFSSEMVREYGGIFLRKTKFFSGTHLLFLLVLKLFLKIPKNRA